MVVPYFERLFTLVVKIYCRLQISAILLFIPCSSQQGAVASGEDPVRWGCLTELNRLPPCFCHFFNKDDALGEA